MKNLLIRALTVMLAVIWQFTLSLLIQLWTTEQPVFLAVWFISLVGMMLVVAWAFLEVHV